MKLASTEESRVGGAPEEDNFSHTPLDDEDLHGMVQTKASWFLLLFRLDSVATGVISFARVSCVDASQI